MWVTCENLALCLWFMTHTFTSVGKKVINVCFNKYTPISLACCVNVNHGYSGIWTGVNTACPKTLTLTDSVHNLHSHTNTLTHCDEDPLYGQGVWFFQLQQGWEEREETLQEADLQYCVMTVLSVLDTDQSIPINVLKASPTFFLWYIFVFFFESLRWVESFHWDVFTWYDFVQIKMKHTFTFPEMWVHDKTVK